MTKDEYRERLACLLMRMEVSKNLEVKQKIKEEINLLKSEYKKLLIEEIRSDNNDKHKGK